MTIEQVKKLKAMVVEVELIKNEEAFSEKDIKEIAEGQEKIIKKQDELIDYMLSLLQCWWMRATLMSVPKGEKKWFIDLIKKILIKMFAEVSKFLH